MAKHNPGSVEQRIVDAIIFDLSDRRGLSGEWDGIDDEIKAQIRKKWMQIIRQELAKAGEP